MDGELLSLKWNNHRTTFLHVIGTLRNKASYTDATLACEGKFYPVHQLVLSTCSEYFADIFERTACKSPVIVLKDIDCKDLEFLLDYMYVGEVNVRQTELAALIKAAECLKIKGLAVPDEEPNKNNNRKESRSADFESSPPAKRRRQLEERRKTPIRISGSEGDKSNVDKSDNSNFETCSVDLPVKVEPVDEQSDSQFAGNSEFGDDPVLGGETDSDRTDFPNLFNNTVEKEEPPNIGDYNESDFPGPSGLQNNSVPSWETESNSFQSDSMSGAVAASASQSQQPPSQQQQLCNVNNSYFESRILCNVPSPFESLTMSDPYDDTQLNIPSTTPSSQITDTESRRSTFSCPMCSYRTLLKGNMKRHLLIHTSQKPYSCPLCAFASKDQSSLKRHVKYRHPHDTEARQNLLY